METIAVTTSGTSRIKKVISGCTLINPILLNVDNRPLTEDELDNCQCSWYKDETDPATRMVKFSTSSSNVYQGITKLEGNFYKNMLVLQNKKTNKIQLIEIGKCQLGRVFQKPSLRTDYDNDEMELTYADNKAKLLKAFGSKKSNRASEIGSKLKINSAMMTSHIKTTAADVSVDVKELEMAHNYSDECVPPCHRDAETVDSVYLVEDFLSPRELASMEDEAFTILHIMPFTEEESGYSNFFIKSLEQLQNKMSIERIKALLLVEMLFRFYHTQFGSMKNPKKRELEQDICPFSNLIGKKLIEEYTIDTREGRVKTATMVDKIVTHIMALLIIACDTCNADELSRCLPNFSIIKIGQIARTLCFSTKDKVNWCIKLPLPQQKAFYLKKRKQNL